MDPDGTELAAAPIRKPPIVKVATPSLPPILLALSGPIVVSRVLLVRVAAHAKASRKMFQNGPL